MANTIKYDKEVLIEIKKSKFIGYTFFCENVEAANNCIKQLNAEHKKATHVCYSYVINSNEKANDDGEPQGTAGIPILDVIKKQKLENVLVAVVRYFGGIKLGAGGLVRAYSETASEVIKLSEIATLLKVVECKTTFNYGEENLLNALKQKDGVYNVQVNYVDKLEVTFCLDKNTILNDFNFEKFDEKLIRV
ncbi:MAG: YigZ family protein [Clostridia bacterium]|nr:YigZ family protein [Clostridia bacterium]